LDADKNGWYIRHTIPKRSGGVRILEEPVDWLKEVQTGIYRNILIPNFRLSPFAYGGVLGKNIANAASLHVSSKIKLKMDIDNFFPSVTSDMIIKALSTHKGLTEGDVADIANLCTNAAGVLPQGGVTSMALANIVCTRLHNVIGKIASRMGIVFTIYVDDLVFSGDNPQRIIPIVHRVCSRYGFKIKRKKTVIMRRKQEVLGLCATSAMPHPRLPKRVRNSLRGKLHSIAKSLEGGVMPEKDFIGHTLGMVAFAHMAMDQKGPQFAAKAVRINQMIRDFKKGAPVETSNSVP